MAQYLWADLYIMPFRVSVSVYYYLIFTLCWLLQPQL